MIRVFLNALPSAWVHQLSDSVGPSTLRHGRCIYSPTRSVHLLSDQGMSGFVAVEDKYPHSSFRKIDTLQNPAPKLSMQHSKYPVQRFLHTIPIKCRGIFPIIRRGVFPTICRGIFLHISRRCQITETTVDLPCALRLSLTQSICFHLALPRTLGRLAGSVRRVLLVIPRSYRLGAKYLFSGF